MSFKRTIRHIHNVLQIKNHDFHKYVYLIYPDELKVKDTTKTDLSASYLDVLVTCNIDSTGRIRTTLYDKHDGFNAK
jgi:hypothetical protein